MSLLRSNKVRIGTLLAAAAAAGGGVGASVVAAGDEGTTAVAHSAVQPEAAASASTRPLSVREVYRRNAKGVVEILATSQASDGSPFPFGSGEQQAQGTGFVLDGKGDIVTNEHVVDGATSVSVKFPRGATYRARVVGTDASTDLAVVRVDAPRRVLHPLSLGDSSTVEVGDGVVAIGAPFGLAGSVTSGIVSALHREIEAPNDFGIEGAIQTDAAINHGNSGGPLLNMRGQVIGVTAQIKSESGGSDGVGFAIPSNTVRSVASQLIADGKADHAYLGVQIRTGGGGAQIGSVVAGSAAARAGLRAQDVITAVNGQRVGSASALRELLGSKKPGDRISVTITRGGSKRTLSVTLGNRPS
jgi:putative serine protease PepD